MNTFWQRSSSLTHCSILGRIFFFGYALRFCSEYSTNIWLLHLRPRTLSLISYDHAPTPALRLCPFLPLTARVTLRFANKRASCFFWQANISLTFHAWNASLWSGGRSKNILTASPNVCVLHSCRRRSRQIACVCSRACARTSVRKHARSHMESELTLWSEGDNSMVISVVCNQFLFSCAVVRHYRQNKRRLACISPSLAP